jgi:hypothetical protein
MERIFMIFVILTACIAFGEEEQMTIFDAIMNGNTTEVRRMASMTKNLDARDNQGRTPLMLAAEEANMECVRVLVDAGADIDATDKGFTVIDQLESMLRRINSNTPEFKQKRIEQMRRERFSEDVVRKDIQMFEASVPRQKNADDVQKWQVILDYLKKVKESKTERKQ